MNKDVRTPILSNVLSVLSDYTNQNLDDFNVVKNYALSELFSDSLSVLEIIYELEDLYQVTINAERLRGLNTISDLASALDQELTTAAQ